MKTCAIIVGRFFNGNPERCGKEAKRVYFDRIDVCEEHVAGMLRAGARPSSFSPEPKEEASEEKP